MYRLSSYLKALIQDHLAQHLRETRLSKDQCIEPDPNHENQFLLTASVFETWQLTWWILGQGAAIEVLAPQSLRVQIADSLKEAAARYA
jgi:predicted DNA-binding transcriptional regulator YafY